MAKHLTLLPFRIAARTALAFLTACNFSSTPFDAPVDASVGTIHFVGREVCADCHQNEYEMWQDSHHDLAMQVASAKTVQGNFGDVRFVHFDVTSRFYKENDEFKVQTQNGQGELQSFAVSYTFGVYPLQQYLIEFPGGRFQVLDIAWDSRPADAGGQRWFHLYSNERINYDDPRHWTGHTQNWNYMCAECHVTNFEKKFSSATGTYESTWSEIDVSCEACHGPGSGHVEWAKDGKLDGFSQLVVNLDDRGNGEWKVSETTGLPFLTKPKAGVQQQPESCGRCHSRRTPIKDGYDYGQLLLDSHMPVLLDPGLYHSDGQILDEVYVYGSFLQSKMYRAGVTCTDCHDAHSLKLKVAGEPSRVCGQCHAAARFSTAGHHFHAEGEVDCVDCHMPAKTYMEVDPRRDHSFRIPRPDLSVKTGAPNACTGCHEGESAAWAAANIQEWYGPVGEEWHYGSALHAAVANAPARRDLLLRLADNASAPPIARATGYTLLETPYSTKEIAALRRGLEAQDPFMRIGALRALERLPTSLATQLGSPLLHDDVRGVRVTAVDTLAASRGQLRQAERSAFDVAAREFVQSQQASGETAAAQTNLGDFYRKIGELEKALSAYELATKLQPDWVPALVNLADLHSEMRNHNKALDELRSGLRMMPNDASLNHAMGIALIRGGDTEGAITFLANAASLAPNSLRYSYVYALALHSTGSSKRALALLQNVNRISPGSFDILWALVTINRDIRNIQKARKFGDLLIAEFPDISAAQDLHHSLQAVESN